MGVTALYVSELKPQVSTLTVFCPHVLFCLTLLCSITNLVKALAVRVERISTETRALRTVV